MAQKRHKGIKVPEWLQRGVKFRGVLLSGEVKRLNTPVPTEIYRAYKIFAARKNIPVTQAIAEALLSFPPIFPEIADGDFASYVQKGRYTENRGYHIHIETPEDYQRRLNRARAEKRKHKKT